MTWIDTIILSIVEGITEFLPISSTGHMIIVSSIMGINKDEFVKLFEICVQFGAILAVVALYWKKFFDFSRLAFYYKLIVAVFPALLLGYLFSDKIHSLLESPLTVGLTFFFGGIALLFVDQIFDKGKIDHETNLSYQKGFIIGVWQVLAMLPGVSRSAATIVGGMQQKLTKRFATEFSFFLAVPTMVAATGHDLIKTIKDPVSSGMLKNTDNLIKLGVGNVIAFVVALIAIKTFITYVQKHTFRAFGIYRIIAGIAVFVMILTGVIKNGETKEPLTTQTTVDAGK